MRKLRVLVLMHETLIPPDSLDGYTDDEITEWKTEFDVVHTLRNMGHTVLALGVHDDLGDLRRANRDFKPHIWFNLLEEFHNVGVYDHAVVSYLELIKQHYTGCNPRGLLLAHDKPLAKKILSYHNIPSPDFFVVPRGRKTRLPPRTEFPLMVKSASEDASLGITNASIVNDVAHLEERVEFFHSDTQSDALVETFIPGRELYVSAIGNRQVRTYPIWEMLFENAKPGDPQIATSRVKWDAGHREKLGVTTGRAKNIEPALEQRITQLCKRAYKALSLSGYARLDLRLRKDGKVFLIEANPNPDLSFGEDFAESVESAGVSYEQLLQKIVTLGLNYQAHWRLV